MLIPKQQWIEPRKKSELRYKDWMTGKEIWITSWNKEVKS